MRRFAVWSVVVGVLSAGVSGCKEDRGFDVVPVTGKVYCNDELVKDALIQFMPVGDVAEQKLTGKMATGQIDGNGQIVGLTTYTKGDGVIIGKHKVNVFIDIPIAPDEDDDDPEAGGREDICGRAGTEITITADSKDIEIRMTD